ncbi:acyl carrier protein [Pseudomonas hamedanensis]|uniref:Acyl carrier protein n=1 Tax=Pseudomonas hamedanensis TaxID=2745504 RepID=A0A9E6P4Z5_9PSED|nr:acyl carrier protein [Pseudomonas hamedanensis]QXI19543.1 acyl carrier protein [Pseudomonas hamedanensis]
MATVEERVKEIVSGSLGIDPVDVVGPADFSADLGADSLAVVELVMALEDEFDVKILGDAAEDIATVQQAIDYIKAQIGS